MQKQVPNSDLDFIYQKSKKSFEKIKNHSLLITGATGFFGSWMSQAIQFANNNYNTNIELNLVSRSQTQSTTPLVNHITCNLETQTLPISLHADYCFHMAAQVDKTSLNSKSTANAPLILENVLAHAHQNKLKNFIYTSSGAVYGLQTTDFVSEHDPSNQNISPYGLIKQQEESLLIKQSALNWTIARCFAFVGPLIPLDKNYAVGNFIKNVINDEDIIINSDGTAIRSYMYAADLIIWLITLLTEAQPKSIFNVGSNQAVSIHQLAKKIACYSKFSQVRLLEQQSVLSKKTRYVPNTDLAFKELDLKLHFELDEAIEKTILWYRS